MSIAEIPDNCHTHFRRPTMQEMQILTRDWLMRMTEDTDHLSTSSTYHCSQKIIFFDEKNKHIKTKSYRNVINCKHGFFTHQNISDSYVN